MRVNSIIAEIPCNNYPDNPDIIISVFVQPWVGVVIKPLITLLLFLSHTKECEQCPRCPEVATAGLFSEMVNSVRVLSDMSGL